MSVSRDVVHRLWNNIAINRTLVVLYCLALIITVVLSFLASQHPYFPGDIAIARLVQSIEFRPFDALMWGLSEIGTQGLGPAITVISAGFLLAVHRRLESIFTLLTLSGYALNLIVKTAVDRPRPSADLVIVRWAGGESGFPSGHVMHFVAFYGFLFFLAWTEMKPSHLRTVTLIVLGLPIALIGVSRVYLGAHWPSDAIGAYIIGTLWLTLLIAIYTAVKESQQPHHNQ